MYSICNQENAFTMYGIILCTSITLLKVSYEYVQGSHKGSHGAPTGFPQDSHRAPTGFPQGSHKVPTGLPWGSHKARIRVPTRFTQGSNRVFTGLPQGNIVSLLLNENLCNIMLFCRVILQD